MRCLHKRKLEDRAWVKELDGSYKETDMGGCKDGAQVKSSWESLGKTSF